MVKLRAGRRWPFRLLAVCTALTLVAGVAALYLKTGKAHAVSVDTAVQRFRTAGSNVAAAAPSTTADERGTPATTMRVSSASRGGSSPAVRAPSGPQPFGAPAAGVYVYATTGFEDTDALGGARHDYPEESTITVRPGGCGWTERWQPLEERWDELDYCVTQPGRVVTVIKTFHEFFRQGQEQDSNCDPGSLYLPVPASAGARTHFECRGSFGDTITDANVLGPEAVDVGGERVQGVHVRYDAQFTGSNRGSGSFEDWTSDGGVLLKRVWKLSIKTDSPFGTVSYHEEYAIVLTSADPRT